MNSYIDNVKPYLAGMSLEDPEKLAEVVSVCGAVLGFWGLHGMSVSRLRRFSDKGVRMSAYRDFDIPKKSGGVRHISAPVKRLKQIQQALNLMLQASCEVSAAANGFVAGRSVATNAEVHLGSSVVFNCDLKDFFPSIDRRMVGSALRRELKPFSPSEEVVQLLSSLMTMPDGGGVEVLPQGAPTSPVVSNLVLKPLDSRLMGFAEKNGYRYSRYADDLTFSVGGECRRPVAIKWETILMIIEESGLKVNPGKTRILERSGRMEVTGLTVGGKINVAREYVKQLRVLLHLWESRGFEEAQKIYIRDFLHGEQRDLSRVIRGKINYLRMIKGAGDSTYRRFRFRYKKLVDSHSDDNRGAVAGE